MKRIAIAAVIAAGVVGGFYACIVALLAAAMITGRYSP